MQAKDESVAELTRLLTGSDQLPASAMATSASALPISHPMMDPHSAQPPIQNTEDTSAQGIVVDRSLDRGSNLGRSSSLPGVVIVAAGIAIVEAAGSVYGYLKMQLPEQLRSAIDAAAGLASAAAIIAMAYP